MQNPFNGSYNCWLVVWTMNFIFPFIGNFIIPTDEVIFFRGVGIPPSSSYNWNFLRGSWRISPHSRRLPCRRLEADHGGVPSLEVLPWFIKNVGKSRGRSWPMGYVMEDLIDISWDMEFDQLAGHQWEFDRFLVEDHGDFSRELIWGHNGSQRFFFFFEWPNINFT